MTISTHVYSAYLTDDPSTLLDVLGGGISFDAGRSPHVEGTLTITQDADVADLLDPRMSPPPRVTVEVLGTFGVTTQSRTFDLTLRSRPVSQDDATMQLELSSDEALVSDYAPMADVDLRALTDLATLSERVILDTTGETVTVTGSTADITPLWDATNLLPNPSFEVDTVGWTAGAGASALTRVSAVGLSGAVGSWMLRWTTTASDSDIYPVQARVRPGERQWWSILLYSPTPRNARLSVQFLDANSVVIGQVNGAYNMTSAAGLTRHSVNTIAPANAAFIFVFVHTTGNSGGQQHYADGAYVVASVFDPGYFDGATTDTADYDYAWTGTANASTSTRVALHDAPTPEALVWDAGQNGMDFLAPLVQASGLRLVCDELRAWTLRDADWTASGSLTVVYGVNMTHGEDTIDRDDETWFDAAVTEYIWTDIYGIEQRVIDSYSEIGYSRARRFEKRTAFPGPGFSEYAVKRAEGRGRQVTASTVSDWRVSAEQPVSVVLNGAPTQTGKTQTVVFDLDSDEVTVTTRTTDTPPTAYIIGPVGVSYLDVPGGIDYVDFDWSDV